MKIIVIGSGSIGKRHAANIRALRPDARLVIADPKQQAPRGAFQVYRDWVEALQSHTYDCAVIASPTEFHYEQLLACCERGIPALVEKPPATAAQLEHYRALVERYQDLRYAIGFQYRFHDKFQEICVMAERHQVTTKRGQRFYEEQLAG